MKNKFVTLLASVGMCASLGAQTWIWYPGIMRFGWVTR